MDTSEPRAVARAIAVSRVIALLAIGVGSAVLLGWTFGLERLTRVLPGTGVMKPWSALSFVCAGLSLTCLHARAARSPGRARAGVPCRILALPVASIGALTLFEYLSGLSLGVDSLLFADSVRATHLPWPGRMTAAAGAGFLGLGSSLVFIDRRLGRLPAHQVLAAVPGMTGLLGLLGYLYGPESL